MKITASARSTPLLITLMATALSGQGSPTACFGSDLDANASSYLWGGETRQCFSLPTASGEVMWMVGDGGQILRREDQGLGYGCWEFADTPDGFHHTLLDVFFLDEYTGWATGWGGNLLETVDGGRSWNLFSEPPVASCDGPAMFWRSRFVTPDLGFLCGLWTFQRWDGTLWANPELYSSLDLLLDPQGAPDMVSSWIEFYALDFLRVGDHWIGLVAGQAWSSDQNIHCPDDLVADRAVVFMTDSRVGAANGGTRWWKVFDQADHPNSTIDDPWDLEFAPDSDDLDSATVYLTGGLANANGAIFASHTSGRDWVEESFVGGSPFTLYGVGALADGGGIAVGYGGHAWTRDPSTSPALWRNAKPTGFTGPLADAHAIIGDGGGDDAIITGSWGFARETNVALPLNGSKPTWISVNPAAAGGRKKQFRLDDLCFLDASRGFAVGQFEAVAMTEDGGVTWEVANSDTSFGPPAGPGGKLFSIALDPSQSVGVAVGRMKPTPSAAPDEHACYVWDAAQSPFVVGAPKPTWKSTDLPVGLDRVKLNSVAHVEQFTFMAVGTSTVASTEQPLVLLGTYDPVAELLTWSDVTPGALPTDLRMADLVMLGPSEGIVVGHVEPEETSAYLVQLGAQVSFLPVTVSPSVGRLHEVAANGPSRFSAKICAVGRGGIGSQGLVLQYSPDGLLGTGGSFSRMVPWAPESSLDYTSIAMAGNTILVGQGAEADELTTTVAGRLLRFDGVAWEALKALTCELVPAIFLLDEQTGWYLGDGGDLDTEFGTVGDSKILGYDAGL